jgi:hypothetical protein
MKKYLDATVIMALFISTLICCAVALSAEPARVEAPAPPAKAECPATKIVQMADAICVLTGANPGNGNQAYTCFDKKGSVFFVIRTRGSNS